MTAPVKTRGWSALLTPGLLLDLFVLANFGGLIPDISIAHAVNRFERWPEWIPLVYSIAAVPLLLIAVLLERTTAYRRTGGGLALCVGWCAVLVGVAGLLLHLDSQFFRAQTLHSLVYTAPFAAPLAYCGLGLLVILNRMVDRDSLEWSQWVVLLAAGGFAGNFVLSLADHAQNAFFHRAEWIPVIAAAFGFAFLLVAAWPGAGKRFRDVTIGVMVVQGLVGLLGFYLHLAADLAAPGQTLRERFLYGAPIFAPLLFANLALLGILGTVVTTTRSSEVTQQCGAGLSRTN